MNSINIVKVQNVCIDCKPGIFGMDSKKDKLEHFSYTFDSSKVYGIVNKSGSGAWALSYMLAGKARHKKGDIFFSDTIALGQDQLQQKSCYVGDIFYKRNRLGMKYYPPVQQLLEEKIVLSKDAIKKLVDELELSPSRMDRSLQHISNERWNASVAIGLAQGKSIFCFPLLNSDWKEMLRVRLKTCSEVLKKYQCITIIPSDSESIVSEVADEIVYVE